MGPFSIAMLGYWSVFFVSDTIEVHVTWLTSSNMNFSIENSRVTRFWSILKMSLWLVNLECVTFLFCVAVIICQNKKWTFHFQYGLICSSQKCFGGKCLFPKNWGGRWFLINSLWRICFFTRVVWSPMFTPYLGKWSSFFRQSFSVAPPLATWYYFMEEIRRSPVEVGSWNPIIYRVLYIPGGAGFRPSTVILDMTCLSKKPKV